MKIKSIKLSKKVKLFIKLQDVIQSHAESIYKEKQLIPWSGTNVGPTYAVTTSCVSYSLGQMEHQIRDILRNTKLR